MGGNGDQALRSRKMSSEGLTCGSSYTHLVLLGTGSWAAQLLTQGILSQWLCEVQYELGFQFSHTWKTTRSGHVSFCFQHYWGILKTGEGEDRGWDGWMASLTQWTWVWINSGSLWWAWHAEVHGVSNSQTRLRDWTELMQTADSLEKTLMLGKIEGGRGRRWQRLRWFDGITNSMDMTLCKLREFGWTGRPGELRSMGSQRAGHDWATKQNWTYWGIIDQLYKKRERKWTHSVVSNSLRPHGL